MIDYNKILISTIMLLFAQIVTWFQLFGQFKWDYLKDNYLVIALSGIPISLIYYYSTRLSVEGFGNAWSPRIIQFIMGIVVFTYFKKIFLSENLNLKNSICLALCLVIVLIQAFWKS